ncbi:DNA-binding transcriptional regulator, AcrR family [Arthrobacter subterraneus]|uniref:DNA-binding transcriptional regulator, AcrR family n=1 Tax=Arthrobacter subterraneus TaxID=335973 RepID=A0A1G8GFI5_9MICC|nr:TetR/AcrR family transcriptional regulator [Arthrobacter subterraneus]SDH93101.1 DNA-binding transcriptional regulator, AcrR family [Arthrobacter subterraneus]
MDAPAPTRMTGRSLAKASRRAALLDAAAQLFAERGYNGVSIEDLGSAAGVSGPAVYRHFSGKPAVLAALLAGVSQDLLEGGRAVVAESPSPEQALRGLIEFQVDFALRNANVIRVQDRDLSWLTAEDQETVRSLQRTYVEVWVDALAELAQGADRTHLRRKAHAAFGLINSTPHSTHRRRSSRDTAELRQLLEEMAWAALSVEA